MHRLDQTLNARSGLDPPFTICEYSYGQFAEHKGGLRGFNVGMLCQVHSVCDGRSGVEVQRALGRGIEWDEWRSCMLPFIG
jgi:hypothetical protein